MICVILSFSYFYFKCYVVCVTVIDEKSCTGEIMAIWSYRYPRNYTPGPLLLTWISNYINHKMWDEITYPFPNFNGAAVEVWKWLSNFIPHFTGNEITYPCLVVFCCGWVLTQLTHI